MLNPVQHFQQKYIPCPVVSAPTNPTQLCSCTTPMRLLGPSGPLVNTECNPKLRRCSNCVKSSPGQSGMPSGYYTQNNAMPSTTVRRHDESWLGVA